MPHLPYVKLFCDTLEVFAQMDDATAGRLIKAVLEYANGRTPQLTGAEALVFLFLRQQIDRDRDAYDLLCERNQRNGSKHKSKYNPVGATGSRSIEDKDKEKDKEKDKDKDKKRVKPAIISRKVSDEDFTDGITDIMSRKTGG